MGDTAATDSYRVLLSGGEGEIVEKKSRFIATIRKCETEEEAVAFIEEMKKKYWDARHNCSAFIIGSRGELTRCSDDGEPSGTAGRPMLEVLTGSGIRNIAVVVTRYFGGTLLGTGGLVRAYTQAVKEGLAHCETGILRKGCELEVTTASRLWGIFGAFCLIVCGMIMGIRNPKTGTYHSNHQQNQHKDYKFPSKWVL